MPNLFTTPQTGPAAVSAASPAATTARRATYGQIQAHCRRAYGFTPQTCWIADVLAEQGLTRRQAPNRKNPDAPRKPCPPHRKAELVRAIRALGMLMVDKGLD
ncbi:hypothetical protein ACO2Q3_21520 [Caulobacter sp. KR2-114]|uniref:hypothetical protein n=1 Tax=Caulobacter sp. KR2-114 TaxID=3400912 RepID=UPI003BFFEBC2